MIAAAAAATLEASAAAAAALEASAAAASTSLPLPLAHAPARDGGDDESYLHKAEEFPTLGGVGDGGGGVGGGGEKAAVGVAWGSGENPWSNRGGSTRLQTGGQPAT